MRRNESDIWNGLRVYLRKLEGASVVVWEKCAKVTNVSGSS